MTRRTILIKMRKQAAVYWGTPTPDGYGGFTYAAPIDTKVRWEDKAVLFRDQLGQEVTSAAVVYVGIDAEINGLLWLGSIATLPSDDSDPAHIAGVRTIKGFDKNPNLKATEFLRKAYLI